MKSISGDIMDTARKDPPLFYRVDEARFQLGVSRATIYRMVKSGDLCLKKIGKRASGITSESVMALRDRA